MKLSQRTELAIQACAYLLRRPQQVVNAKVMAGDMEVSKTHLAKVMQDLVRSGIVESVRGYYGGFRIVNDDASVLDAIQSLEERLVSEKPTTPEVQKIRDAIEAALTEKLGSMKLLDL